MGPKPRLEVPDGIHHVTARGNAREAIFHDDLDYLDFVRTLAEQIDRQGWSCHSFCLMPNHYHLLLETPQPNLAVGMQRLNGSYARRFNARHRRVGHVFQGPYGAQLVARDEHLVELCRYIALNPVRAQLCSDPSSWRWSSYAGGFSFVESSLTASLFPDKRALDSFLAAGL